MKQKLIIFSITLISAFMLCCPFAFADDGGDGQNKLGIALGLGVVIASGLVMTALNSHFKKKREEAEKRNRANAKRKKKKKR